MRGARVGIAIVGSAVLWAAAAALAPAAEASLLCKTRRGALIVREACKAKEQALGPAELDTLGLRGPAGPVGPPGPPGGGLKVVDANGAEVGLVTTLGSYYGQYARVIREAELPDGAGPEFIAFSVTPSGLGVSPYACAGYYGTYYPNADCTGPVYQECDYGSCSSAGGAFFTEVGTQDGDTACYARGGDEFVRGDFYHELTIGGPSIAFVTTACTTTRGGTLTGPVTPCGPGFFCVQCCAVERGVGVAPVHTFDASTISGTPPLRLAR